MGSIGPAPTCVTDGIQDIATMDSSQFQSTTPSHSACPSSSDFQSRVIETGKLLQNQARPASLIAFIVSPPPNCRSKVRPGSQSHELQVPIPPPVGFSPPDPHRMLPESLGGRPSDIRKLGFSICRQRVSTIRLSRLPYGCPSRRSNRRPLHVCMGHIFSRTTPRNLQALPPCF
jgi:hypothetical protein